MLQLKNNPFEKNFEFASELKIIYMYCNKNIVTVFFVSTTIEK